MKKTLQLFFVFFITIQLSAQNFTGQWKGYFTDKSSSFVGWGGDRCEYTLEIECNGENVSGYSYTYFNEGGKRYYTICKLTGTINKGGKFIEVKEIERTKTNVPNNIRNCFQVHRLTYSKQGEDQTLEGSWVPASKQEGDCGYGSTVLNRRELQKNSALAKSADTKTKKIFILKDKNKTDPLIVAKGNPRIVNPLIPKDNKVITQTERDDQKQQDLQSTTDNQTSARFQSDRFQKVQSPLTGKTDMVKNKIVEKRSNNFEKRNSNYLKTIEIENEDFKVDLYDNGDIDGDSISLFFNGKLILANKRLSDKAISLHLNVDDEQDINELVMYANNLGFIPPNTALMVVTDGDKRYEVRISSDLQKSGAIRFIRK